MKSNYILDDNMSADEIIKKVKSGEYTPSATSVNSLKEKNKQINSAQIELINKRKQDEKERVMSLTNTQKAAAQLVNNQLSDDNNMSYEERKENLKEQKKTARNNVLKAEGKYLKNAFLAGILEDNEENSVQKALENLNNAKGEYKDSKQKLEDLKKTEWNETQDRNSKSLSDDAELAELVKTAYGAKVQYDSAQEKMTAQPSYSNMNSAVSGIPSLVGYQNVDNEASNYNKALKAITDKGYTAKEAESLIDTYSRQMNAQAQEKRTEKTEKFADEHPVLASGAYVAANVGQLAGVKETIQSGVSNAFTDDYKPLDTNSYGFAATNFRNTVSQTVSENIQNDVAEKTDSKVAANAATFLYQTGLSMGDFASLAGLGEPASLAIMGTSAAMSTAKEATDRGASADKALATALWAGTAEIVFEKLSLENLNALKATGRSGAKNIILDILRQSFTEGSEEVFTDIANAIGDSIINGDNAELKQRYNELINSGLSDREAWKQVATEFAIQLGESYLGGSLSGGVMGAGGVTYGNVKANSNYSRVGNQLKIDGTVQSEINTGLASDMNSKAYKAAAELQSKLENSISYDNDMKPIDYSSLSNKKIGQLQHYNTQAISQSAFSEAVANESNSVKLNEIFDKVTEGKGVSNAEANTIASSNAAVQAINAEFGTDYTSKTLNKSELNELSRFYYNDAKYNSGAVISELGTQTNAENNTQSKSVQIPEKAITLSDGSSDYISSINKVENGEVYLNTSDGRIVRASEVNFADNNAKLLYSGASAYNTNEAKSYVMAYYDNSYSGNVADYSKGFGAVYMAQQQGKSIEQAYNAAIESGSHITTAQADVAYDTAKNNADISYQAHPTNNNEITLSNAETANTASQNNVLLYNKTKADFNKALRAANAPGATVIAKKLTKSQQAETELIGEFAKKIGKEVIVVEDTEELGYGKANGFYANGKIVLALNADGGMMFVYFGHELFHDLKMNSTIQAQKLEDFVIKHLKNDSSYDYNKRVDEIIELNKFEGSKEQQVAQANEEIAANACFTVLSEQENFEKLVKQDKSLAQKVRDFFADFIDKIKNALRDISSRNAEYKALKDDIEAKKQILAMFDDCLKASQKNTTITNDSIFSTGIKFSKKINDYPYNMQTVIKDYLNSTDSKILDFIDKFNEDGKFNRLFVSNVSERQIEDIRNLLSIDVSGFSNNVNTNAIEHIEKRHGKNGVADNSMSNNNDIARMGYILSEYDSVELLLDINGNPIYSVEFQTKDNKPAPMVLYKKKINGTYYLVESVVDGKYKKLWLSTAYINKKGTVTQTSDSSNAAPKFYAQDELASPVPINNITQNENVVNSYDMQDKPKFSLKDSDGNELSKQQQKYFENSKVLDKNGNLLVVYHGSPNEFTVFDREKIGSTTGEYVWGRGFYFSNNEHIAQTYARNSGNTQAYYLNIINPFRIETKKDVEKFNGLYLSETDVTEENYDEWLDNPSEYLRKGLELGTQKIIEAGHDGVIASYGSSDTEYVVFNSNQIKNVDNLNPTDNEDIRFSRKEQPIDYNTLLNENEELSAMNEDLKRMLELTSKQNEKLKNEFKITDRHNISNTAVDKVVAQLRKQYSSSCDKSALVSRISALYDYMANAGADIDMGYIWQSATDIAKNIIDHSQQKDTTVYDEYKDLRNYIRNTAISVPQTVKDNFIDYDKFRRENFGKLRLSNNGVELDAFYKELSTDYPEFFVADVSEEQQLEALANFFEITSPVYYNAAENAADSMDLNIEQFANVIAGDIFEKYFDVPEVMTVAEKHKKEIDTLKMHYRNQIDEMKQSYKERYEERLKEVKAENKQRVDKLRSDKAEALAKQKAHFEDVSRRGTERRKAANIKRKIKNVKKQLDTKLLNPTDNSYVPQYLVKEIASVCDMITEADKYYKNGNMKAESTILKLDSLHRQYEQLAKDSNYDYASEFDSDIAENISALADTLNGKQISELSLSQLEDVYNVIKDIKNSLVDATKQIGRDENISNHELGVKIIKELNATKGKWGNIIGMYEMDTLNPIRAIRKITEYNDDAELYKLMLELNNGQRKADKFISDASKPFVELQNDKKAYKKFISEEISTGIIDKDGNELKLTENQLAQLIMTAKREQGITHIERGGFVVADVKSLAKGKMSKAKIDGVTVGATQVSDIIRLYEHLSDYGKKWIDTSDVLFNVQGKKALNDTSMILKHRKLANAKNYIPLVVDSNFTSKEIEGVKIDKTIEGMGSLKSTVPNAGQPVIIQGLNTVVDKHINDVSKYYGFAIPIRNFNKVYKVQTSQYYDADLGKTSVKTALENKWGSYGTELIDSVLADLQTSRTARNPSYEFVGRVYDKIQQGFVQATLAGNISVTIKQAASYPTAGAVLSTSSLAKGLTGFTYLGSKQQALFDEIDEHTGTHYKRRIGMSTQEIGDLTKENALMTKLPAFINPMKWIQAMDVQTTAALWIASKAEIEAKYPDIQKNSSEYWKNVQELYDYVIETTQPNYDVLHRPEIQKTTNKFVKSVVMFKTQPLQNTGIIYDALFNLRAKESQYKASKTNENAMALKTAKKNFSKAVKSQTAAALTFAAMSLLAAAIKHTMTGYRDDDDKVTLASVLSGYFNSMASLFASIILPIGGSEIFEIGDELTDYVKAKVNGGKFNASSYDIISAPTVKTINDFISAINGLLETTGDVIAGDKSSSDELEAFMDIVTQSATILGVPLDNAVRYSQGLVAHIKDAVNGEFGSFEYGVDRKNSQKLHMIENDLAKGDKSSYEKYADEIYASSASYDLLYAVLKQYGFNSSQYKTAESKCIEIKKENGASDPKPETSMKNKAVKEYADLKENGTYEEAEDARQRCIEIFGSMNEVEKALKKLK